MKTLVLYHTKTGHTLEAINPIVESIIASGGEAKVVLAKDFVTQIIHDYESLIVASPCWAGSSGVVGVAAPLVKVLKNLPTESLKDKLIGGVAIHAQTGGEATLSHLEKLLSRKGCENFKSAPVIKAGVLMSLYKGPSVSQTDKERLSAFGREFVKETSKA